MLGELQDRLPPFSSEDAFDIIYEELGESARHIFPEMTEEPIAAASFGQVHFRLFNWLPRKQLSVTLTKTGALCDSCQGARMHGEGLSANVRQLQQEFR